MQKARLCPATHANDFVPQVVDMLISNIDRALEDLGARHVGTDSSDSDLDDVDGGGGGRRRRRRRHRGGDGGGVDQEDEDGEGGEFDEDDSDLEDMEDDEDEGEDDEGEDEEGGEDEELADEMRMQRLQGGARQGGGGGWGWVQCSTLGWALGQLPPRSDLARCCLVTRARGFLVLLVCAVRFPRWETDMCAPACRR